MKYSKIIAFFLAVILFAACNDDESYNTGDATIKMENATASKKENGGIFTIPVRVTGEHTGLIQFTVKLYPAETNGAVETENYVVTQKTLRMPAGVDSVNVEFNAINDDEINIAREFIVEIESVQGAKIDESAKTTLVTLKDDDSVFYEKLQGQWVYTAKNGSSGAAITNNIVISGVDEDDSDYEKVLTATGIAGYNWTTTVMNYTYDETTKTGNIDIVIGELFASGVTFTGLGVCDIYTGTVSGSSITMNGIVRGSFDGNSPNQITFDPSSSLLGLVFLGTTYQGYWFYHNTLNFAR